MGRVTARQHVAVARALRLLPLTVAALHAGTLSWSKARAIARCATPDTEARLVEHAGVMTAAQLDRLVAYLTAPSPEGEATAAARRGLTSGFGDGGGYRLSVWVYNYNGVTTTLTYWA